MASYLDQPYQFRPYVPTLPVEAMVKVGMMKQEQYDQGVQKIRDYLDNATLLPVSRPVDIQHLQNSINAVTGKLQSLGAADFSNQQLVQSVAGLTKKISRDPIILDGVASTQFRKAELERRAELEKVGKTGINNDIFFNDKWQEYYNSTDRRRFNSSYIPYSDVTKKALDVIKGLHSNLQKFDDPYEILNGVRTGKLADVMRRIGLEEVSEGQIMTALRAAFTPDEYNQLKIDGYVQFKGVTPDKLSQVALQDFESSKKQAADQLKLLQDNIGVYKNKTGEYTRMANDINFYKRQLGLDGQGPGDLEKNYTSAIQRIKDDPDGVKNEIYTNGFFRQFGNGFKWRSITEERILSPYYTVAKDWREYLQKERHHKDTIDAAKEKLKAEHPELYTEPFWQTAGSETERQLSGIENFHGHIADLVNEEQGIVTNLKRKSLDGVPITDKKIEELLALNRSNPSQVPTTVRTSIQTIAKLRDDVLAYDTFDKEQLSKARLKQGLTPELYKELTRGKQGANIRIGGVNTYVSPEDLLAIKNATYNENVPTPSPGGGYINRVTRMVDYNKLTGKQSAIVRALQGKYFGVERTQADLNMPGLTSILDGFAPEAAQIRDRENNAYKDYQNNLSPLMSRFQTRYASAPTQANGEIPPDILAKMAVILKSADVMDIAGNSETNRENGLKLLSDEKNAKVLIGQKGDSYELVITSFKPGDIKDQVLRVNKNTLAGAVGEKYLNKFAKEKLKVDIFNGSTNYSGNANAAHFQTQYGHFPYVRKYNVKADLNAVADSEENFVPTVWLQHNTGAWIPLEISGEFRNRTVGFANGVDGFTNMTDAQLESLIKASHPEIDLNQYKKLR